MPNALTLISIGKDGIIHVAAEGDITTAEVSAERNPLESLLGSNWSSNRVLLDLGKTSYLDSTGIGWLISVNKQFKAQGGTLVIYSVGIRVRQLLDLLRVGQVVKMLPDETAARQYMSGNGQ